MTKMNRERAIFYLEDYVATYKHRLSAEVQEVYRMAIEALRQERPKGRWVEAYDLDYLKFIWSCNQCGEDAPTKPETCDQILKPFCPNCGAEMEK